MNLSKKIKQFKDDFQESKSISDNMLSSSEKLAYEIIEEQQQLIEQQHKTVIEGLIALGDYGMLNAYKEGKLSAKELALLLSRCFDNNTSIEKQLEKAFYTFQQTAKNKMERMGEDLKAVSIDDMIVYEKKPRGKYERKENL